jgi:hypothetical protein
LDDSEKPGDQAMPPQPPRRARAATPDAAFELWLQHGLQKIYGDVAKEPIPPELLALIERDKRKG